MTEHGVPIVNTQSFVSSDWTQIWAGDWSLLTCSQFGELYTTSLIVSGKVFMSKTIFLLKDGKSACYMTQSDKDELGHHLVREVIEDSHRARVVTENLKQQVDQTLGFMKRHQTGEMTQEVYKAFWNHLLEYYKPHVNVKYIVDYLAPELLKKHLPLLEEARVYAEPVFKHSEELMQAMARQIGARVGYAPELILCLVKDELLSFWDSRKLPKKEVLQRRHARSALLVDPLGQLLRIGNEAEGVEQFVHGATDSETIRGSPAFPGKVTGTVRIIIDPSNADHFQEGNILVTGMTRPEYLPIMQKAAAIITDAGGILSHAAITARELKKPTVIGANKATKVLKDGDEVEVDATTGLVTILRR